VTVLSGVLTGALKKSMMAWRGLCAIPYLLSLILTQTPQMLQVRYLDGFNGVC